MAKTVDLRVSGASAIRMWVCIKEVAVDMPVSSAIATVRHGSAILSREFKIVVAGQQLTF